MMSFTLLSRLTTANAKKFYETVFGWKFEAWGPPGFWLIQTSPNASVRGALQKRKAKPTGTGKGGYECTIAVDDIHAIADAIQKAGGKVTLQPFKIESVGKLVQFEDTEGNNAVAMQYERGGSLTAVENNHPPDNESLRVIILVMPPKNYDTTWVQQFFGDEYLSAFQNLINEASSRPKFVLVEQTSLGYVRTRRHSRHLHHTCSTTEDGPRGFCRR